MSKFYLLLWLRWLVRVVLYSLLLGVLLTILVTLGVYIRQGMPPLQGDVVDAVSKIFTFWFALLYNLSLLVVLLREIGYIFGVCHNGFMLEMGSCADAKNRLRRRWLMVLIWLVAVEILLMTFVNFLVQGSLSFWWYSIYLLYGAIAVGGYFSFVLLSLRCKQIKVVRC